MNINRDFGTLNKSAIFHTACMVGYSGGFDELERQGNILARSEATKALRRSAENFIDRRTEDSRPIYEVRCGAQTIEFDRNHKVAYTAFALAAYPCEIIKIEHGLRSVIERKSPPAFHKG